MYKFNFQEKGCHSFTPSNLIQKKNGRYILRIKGPISDQEVMRQILKEQLLRRISPPVNPAQNEHSKYGNATISNNNSSSNKSKSITPKVSNKATPRDTLAIPARGETLCYNII